VAPAVIGHAEAQASFLAALASGHVYHAWLLAGPEGVGKSTFARAAALRLLAGEGVGLDVPVDHPARALAAAGSHPDLRVMSRLPKDADKPDADLARSITVAQVRALQPLFATTPSMGSRRAVIIDAVDDLERGGANALLKSLEEPPAGTVFFLVSHAMGKLLPTVRSRCRLLRFGRLTSRETAAVLRASLPEADDKELAELARVSDGAPGRGLRYAGLDVAGIDRSLGAIAAVGDQDQRERLTLGRALAGKAAQPRYELFLERAPALIAQAARGRQGEALRDALDAHAAARDLAGAAIGLSLDPTATVFEMAGLVARLAPRLGAG
jgi:DNA polymerase-3 subunit delta'